MVDTKVPKSPLRKAREECTVNIPVDRSTRLDKIKNLYP